MVLRFKTGGVVSVEPCPPAESVEALDELIVEDAEGYVQDLYVRNYSRPLGMKLAYAEDMPPEAVEGTFNVRFQSNKMIEGITANKVKKKVSIKLKNVQYPVKLKWNFKNNNKIKYWLVKKGQAPILMSASGIYEFDNSIKGTIQLEAEAEQPCR